MKSFFISTKWNIGAACVLAVFFLASSGGRNNNWANAPGDNGYCINCHSSGTSGGSISLSGVPTGSYQAGTTYTLTLTISDDDAAVGGFQIVATDGSTNTPIGTFSTPAGTKINNTNRLVQSTPKSFSSEMVSWTFDWTSPSAASAPANLQFYYAGNAADGTGNTANDYSYAGVSLVANLPAELMTFSAKTVDNTAELFWETASQLKLENFEVQRSIDKGESYETLTQIKAEGTTSQWNEYFFIDEELPNAEQILYRLKMIDFDNSISYSKIVSIKKKNLEVTVDILSANPLNQGRQISLSVPSDNSIERLTLVGMNGQVVVDQHGNFEGQVDLETSTVKAGTYILFAFDDYGAPLLNKKIVIQ